MSKRSRLCDFQSLETRRLMAVTDLDTAFGTAGRALLDHQARAQDNVNAVALAPGNKIIIGGSSIENSFQHATLARLNLDGTPDTSFAPEGKIKLATPVAFADLIANDDSSITTLSATSTAPIMRRYTATGAVDATFNLSVTPTGTPTDIAPRSDGLLYVVVGNNIMRVNANGAADTNFDGDGLLPIPVEAGGVQFRPQKAVALVDGSVIVGGQYGTTSPNIRNSVFRHYSASGVLDTGFGVSGNLQLPGLSTFTQCDKLMLTGGQVLAIVTDNTASQSHVVRFSEAGVRDSGFDGDGLATVNPSATRSEFIGDVLPDGNGNYLGICMVFSGGSDAASYIFRLTNTGAVDGTFANSGFSTSFTAPFEFNSGNPKLLLPGDGSLYHITALTEPSFMPPSDQFVFKFNASSGVRDMSYAGTGRAAVGFTGSSNISTGQGSVLLPDGGVAFVGNITDIGAQMIVGRLTSTGQPMSTFGPGGLGTTEVNFGTTNANAFGIGRQADGKVLVVGRALNGNGVTTTNDYAIVRLDTNGLPDPGFGGDGTVTTSFADSTSELFNRVVEAPDGRIYASGNRISGGVTTSAIIRYTDTGQVDTTYGTAGRVITTFVTATDGATEIIPVANNKLLVAGVSVKDTGTRDDAYIIRLNENGTLDTNFGTGGKITWDINSEYNRVDQMLVDGSGNIYVVGTAVSATTNEITTVQFRKYNSEGVPDPIFGLAGNGISSFTATGFFSNLFSVSDLDLAAGRLLLYGRTTGTSSVVDVYLINVTADLGAADINFGSGGKATYNLSASAAADGAGDLHVRSDGRWIITGVGLGPGENGNDFSAMSLIGNDSTAPTIAGSFAFETNHQIRLDFNEPVTPPTAAQMTLTRTSDSTNVPVQQAWLSYNASPPRLTITPGPLLADGDYTLTVNGGSTSDISGNTQSSPTPVSFFVLTADANHDHYVNSLDFTALASNFNQSSGMSYSKGDFNYDGRVNALDFNALATKFGAQPAPLALGVIAQSGSLATFAASPRLFSEVAVAEDDKARW